MGLRYGTLLMFSPSCLSQPANMKSSAPVTPAQLSAPDWARVIATRSRNESTCMVIGAAMAINELDTRVIGTRSSGLYGRWSCRYGCAVNDADGENSST